MDRFKNIASICFLVIVFAGFVWLIGTSNYRSLQETKSDIDNQAARGATAIGPIAVDHSTCRYLLQDSALSRLLHNLMCFRCVRDAEHIRLGYDLKLLDDQCHQRGTNTMMFYPRKNRP